MQTIARYFEYIQAAAAVAAPSPAVKKASGKKRRAKKAMEEEEEEEEEAKTDAAEEKEEEEEDSGDENDGGLFLANGTYLNDVPDDESNDGDAADAGDDDVDSDAPEEISFKASAEAKETAHAKGNGAVSKKRGKRGGKRIRLDTSVLDAVAALDSDGSEGSEDDEDGSAAAASFQGSRTTFDSDSEDEGGASKPFHPVLERKVAGAGGLRVRASLPTAKARAAGRPIPAAVFDFRKGHFARHRRADNSVGQRRGKGGRSRAAKQFVVRR